MSVSSSSSSRQITVAHLPAGLFCFAVEESDLEFPPPDIWPDPQEYIALCDWGSRAGKSDVNEDAQKRCSRCRGRHNRTSCEHAYFSMVKHGVSTSFRLFIHAVKWVQIVRGEILSSVRLSSQSQLDKAKYNPDRYSGLSYRQLCRMNGVDMLKRFAPDILKLKCLCGALMKFEEDGEGRISRKRCACRRKNSPFKLLGRRTDIRHVLETAFLRLTNETPSLTLTGDYHQQAGSTNRLINLALAKEQYEHEKKVERRDNSDGEAGPTQNQGEIPIAAMKKQKALGGIRGENWKNADGKVIGGNKASAIIPDPVPSFTLEVDEYQLTKRIQHSRAVTSEIDQKLAKWNSEDSKLNDQLQVWLVVERGQMDKHKLKFVYGRSRAAFLRTSSSVWHKFWGEVKPCIKVAKEKYRINADGNDVYDPSALPAASQYILSWINHKYLFWAINVSREFYASAQQTHINTAESLWRWVRAFMLRKSKKSHKLLENGKADLVWLQRRRWREIDFRSGLMLLMLKRDGNLQDQFRKLLGFVVPFLCGDSGGTANEDDSKSDDEGHGQLDIIKTLKQQKIPFHPRTPSALLQVLLENKGDPAPFLPPQLEYHPETSNATNSAAVVESISSRKGATVEALTGPYQAAISREDREKEKHDREWYTMPEVSGKKKDELIQMAKRRQIPLPDASVEDLRLVMVGKGDGVRLRQMEFLHNLPTDKSLDLATFSAKQLDLLLKLARIPIRRDMIGRDAKIRELMDANKDTRYWNNEAAKTREEIREGRKNRLLEMKKRTRPESDSESD